MSDTYETQARGPRILPGQWRPHYPWEHIAWVSPPWPSQDYLWLDFPEAIFTNQGLVFLSHINPRVPSVYTDLPRVAWEVRADGLRFARRLPNGVQFGGSVTRESETTVALDLYLENGTSVPLRAITLQTCVFLRACAEFADFTLANKFVHLPARGWMPFSEAVQGSDPAEAPGRYGLGWRGGPRLADWPVMVTQSNQAPRLVAMTWYEHTLSLIGNPAHPCFHADPQFPDLDVGQRAAIQGRLIFFEGTLDAFAATLAFD